MAAQTPSKDRGMTQCRWGAQPDLGAAGGGDLTLPAVGGGDPADPPGAGGEPPVAGGGGDPPSAGGGDPPEVGAGGAPALTNTCQSPDFDNAIDLRPTPLRMAGYTLTKRKLMSKSSGCGGKGRPVGVMGGRPGTGGAGTGSTLAPDGMEMPDALAELTAADAACKHHTRPSLLLLFCSIAAIHLSHSLQTIHVAKRVI